MWTLNNDFAERGQFKRYAKRHGREFAACFANLDRLCAMLNGGGTLQQAETGLGFFSSEGGDIYRIGQTGVPHAKETRLYVFALLIGGAIYILTIGGKDTQQDDLQRCREIVKRIRQSLEAGQ